MGECGQLTAIILLNIVNGDEDVEGLEPVEEEGVVFSYVHGLFNFRLLSPLNLQRSLQK